jgi:hypothetical protein
VTNSHETDERSEFKLRPPIVIAGEIAISWFAGNMQLSAILPGFLESQLTRLDFGQRPTESLTGFEFVAPMKNILNGQDFIHEECLGRGLCPIML